MQLSTHPSGSLQSSGKLFQITVLKFCASRCSSAGRLNRCGPSPAGVAVRSKQFFRMGEFSDALLRAFDLVDGVSKLRPVAQGNRMRKRVIADPVARRMGLLHQAGRGAVIEFPSDDEERRKDFRPSQEVEHALGNTRRRAVVKGERDASFGQPTAPCSGSHRDERSPQDENTRIASSQAENHPITSILPSRYSFRTYPQ
jgi:hypothetical protein